MTESPLLEGTAEELFEDAPCGYVSTAMDGTILKVNQTFETWMGLRRNELLGARRFQDLLTAGGRIYYETYCRPLLHMQGGVREIAMDLLRADGSLLPALVNSVVRTAEAGAPQIVRTTVFDATDRRRYEQELLRSQRREHEVAQALQRSMLGGELPAAPGLEVYAAYRPAVTGLEVGGDWYDAFWLDGDTVALVVGDVVGRGIDAAAAMGQLRSATRALASTGLRSAELLSALDRYARRHAIGEMTTVVYADLSLVSGRVRYACAGHPPPVLVPAGAEPRLLWEGRSMPLAVFTSDVAARAEAHDELNAGDALLLYTDGLVERRTESMSEGLERLRWALGARRGEPPASIADGVVRDLHEHARSDDVCVLVVRRRADGAARETGS